MGKNFTDTDKGWKKFCTNFKTNAGETSGFVGYLRSSGDYKNEEQRTSADGGEVEDGDPITMAQLAAVHEYGSADGSIPQRSFMGSAIDENAKELKRLTKKAVDKVIMGRVSKKQAIGLLCQKFKDLFINKIVSGPFTPLAAATIRRKGSDKPLIDTGQLKGAIDWEVKGGGK